MDPDETRTPDDERPRLRDEPFAALLAHLAPSPAAGAPTLMLALGLAACSLALLVPTGLLQASLATAAALLLLAAGLLHAHRRRRAAPELQPTHAARPLRPRDPPPPWEPEPPFPDALRFPAPPDDASDHATAIVSWRDRVVQALQHGSTALPRNLRDAAGDLLRGLGAEPPAPDDDTPVFPSGSPSPRDLLRWRLALLDMLTIEPRREGGRSESVIIVVEVTRGGRILFRQQFGPSEAIRKLLEPHNLVSRCPSCLAAFPEALRDPRAHECPLPPGPAVAETEPAAIATAGP